MNGLAICAGTGGLDLALQIAEPRYRTVCYVEREAGAAASLVARMEDKTLDRAPVWDDLGTLCGKRWRGLLDIITSGDPCQPNSHAGKGLGADDERWLIDQLVRVVDESRPDRLFRENVTGNTDGQLEALIPALERLGYRCAAGIFAASETGAKHERQRLFIMADCEGPGQQSRGCRRRVAKEHAELKHKGTNVADAQGQRFQEAGECGCSGESGTGQPGTELANPFSCGHHGRTHDTGRQAVERAVVERPGSDMADTRGTGLQGRELGGPSRRRDGSQAHGPVTELCGARLPLFAPGPRDFDAWREILSIDPTLEPAVCGAADGMANRNDRLRLCGNGVSPLAGAYAYRTLDTLLAGASRTATTGNVLTM